MGRFFYGLLPVILRNLLGGNVLVRLVYHFIFDATEI